jgi:hypothetical protein
MPYCYDEFFNKEDLSTGQGCVKKRWEGNLCDLVPIFGYLFILNFWRNLFRLICAGRHPSFGKG